MSMPAPLVTVAWWRVLLERLGRQAAQTAVPILAAVVAATGHVDVRATVLALLGAEAVTVLTTTVRYLADVHPAPDAPLGVQVLDRAVPAAAGVLAGLPVASWADIIAVDWAEAGWAALAAGVTAVIAVYVTPPALATHAAAGQSAASRLRSADDLDAMGSDTGSSRLLAVVVLGVSVLVLAAVPAAAHRPVDRHPSRAVPHRATFVDLTVVLRCGEDAEVAFTLYALGADRHWRPTRGAVSFYGRGGSPDRRDWQFLATATGGQSGDGSGSTRVKLPGPWPVDVYAQLPDGTTSSDYHVPGGPNCQEVPSAA